MEDLGNRRFQWDKQKPIHLHNTAILFAFKAESAQKTCLHRQNVSKTFTTQAGAKKSILSNGYYQALSQNKSDFVGFDYSPKKQDSPVSSRMRRWTGRVASLFSGLAFSFIPQAALRVMRQRPPDGAAAASAAFLTLRPSTHHCKRTC